MEKIYIRTFGCQMNSRDSEFIAGLFFEKGYKLTLSPLEADVILFNTCSVRGHAEERAVHSMAHLMHRHKGKIYGMVGCAAQALGERLFKMLPGLSIVCGTGEIAKLPELVEKSGKGKISALGSENTFLPGRGVSPGQDGEHAYVSIMRGCNNFCSYCVVPYVRGRERSRNVKDIADEVEDLTRRGIKNITLLGQNVNSYRSPSCNFAGLLKIINNSEGIGKIDFMTSHPKDAGSELFKTMRDSENVVKHLHLPLQSGSDRILGLMNRGYTRKEYLGLVLEARRVMADLRLTTDIIVGFPGEADTDFRDTLGLMEEVKFDLAYIFKYSPRPGTGAAGMDDDVPEKVKKERHKTLLDLQRNISKRKRNEKNNRFCYS